MEIILARHAQASRDPKYTADEDRPLTKEGRQNEQQVAKKMITLGIKFTQIWVSPILRAQQTLQIIQKNYRSTIIPEVKAELTWEMDPELIHQMLEDEKTNNPEAAILIVGHNPHISKLLRLLVGKDNPKLGTSDIAWIIWTDEIPYLKRILTSD